MDYAGVHNSKHPKCDLIPSLMWWITYRIDRIFNECGDIASDNLPYISTGSALQFKLYKQPWENGDFSVKPTFDKNIESWSGVRVPDM
jgi:hypothetical protein